MPHFRYPLILLCMLALPRVRAQEASDSLLRQIRGEAQVTALRKASPMQGHAAGEVHWDLRQMGQMPQVLGMADPLRYAQMLPSVQSSTEYDAGLHIQGCGNGQNAVVMGRSIVYNAAHLMGIFSTFNASHFRSFTLSTHARADMPERIGGLLRFDLPEAEACSPRMAGELSLGPLSSQGTLSLSPTPTSRLTLSGRQAYFNLLYSRWIKFDESSTRYGFGDYNFTYDCAPAPGQRLVLNAYYGQDRVSVGNLGSALPSTLRWRNAVAEGCWKVERSAWQLEQSLGVSAYASDLKLWFSESGLQLPSHIRTFSYKGHFARSRFVGGVEAQFHHVQPQNPEVSNSYGTEVETQPVQKAGEVSAYARWRQPLHGRGKWHLELEARATLFHRWSEGSFFRCSPAASVVWQASERQRLELRAGVQHQFLHQVGFTSLGMPTEFWMAASRSEKPQRAECLSVTYDVRTPSHRWAFSAEAYFKHLHHQMEYDDNVLSLLSGVYSLEKALLRGRGCNYGIGLQLTRMQGAVTGWLSYAYGRSLRRFDRADLGGSYPSSFERLHELNATCAWRISPRLSVSGTGIVASGTPFTAPKSFYLLNGNVMAEYGSHNGSRMPAYCRVDLALNYEFRHRQRRSALSHGMNFSLYNALGIRNNVFYRLKADAQTYSYRPVSFIKYPLPSFSYHLKF